MRIWSLLLHESIKPDVEPTSQHGRFDPGVEDPPAMRGSKAFLQQPESQPKPPEQAAAPRGPPSIPRASLAFVGEGNFVLDAAPEDLAWSPHTISVVAWPVMFLCFCTELAAFCNVM